MTQEPPSSSPESIDTGLEALSDASRREILLSLSDPDGAPVAEAAVAEAADRTDAIALIHIHLPKLEDEGFLEWDRENGTLHRGPRFGTAEPFLETIREFDARSRHR